MFCSQSYLQIKQEIKESHNNVNFVAVSKMAHKEQILLAINHGQLCFGENRVADACEKFIPLKLMYPNLSLHLIGHLQKNKVSQAVKIFDVIETIDSLHLATLVNKEELKQGRALKYFAQVNIGGEAQKTGLDPKELKSFLQNSPIKISGLMCIPPLSDNTAFYFLLLKKLAKDNGLSEISMGMSADYKLAIELGATNIRLGSVIFKSNI
jgi:PLP dependent protein